MFKPKIWLRLGALAVAGSATASPKPIHATETEAQSKEVVRQFDSAGPVLAQSGRRGAGGEGGEGGEGDEAGPSRPAVAPKVAPQQQQKSRAKQRKGLGGEGGEGGERGFGPRSDRAWTRGRQLGEGGERGEEGEQGVNTRYIFGFTEGADTERAREKELENDTVGRLGKRSGTYTALQNKSEAEFGVTDNVLVEFGLFGSYHRIQDVPDFDDRNGARFDGAFAELKYRFLDRDVHGFGMAFSVEPEWHRYSELTGRFENSYALELKLFVDKELIPGTLFVAGNLVYEPEAVLAKEFDPDTGQFTKWERESNFQALGAISGAVTSNLFVGAEVRYLAKYEGNFLNHLEGRALYVGPTLYARLSSKSTITLAYSWQVAGKATEEPDQRLDLLNFERQQFRVRWVSEL
jgi:hypothetical protein